MSKGRDIRDLRLKLAAIPQDYKIQLKNVNSQIKTTQAQLKDINNLTEIRSYKYGTVAAETESTC